MSGISQGSGIGDGGELTASEEALIAAIASLGSASQVLAINATADGVEWKTISLSSVWGSITGTLSDQTDLQSALDAKLNSSDVSVFGASLIDDADASTARTTLGLVIGTDVQAYSAVLSATTASFLTAQETKLGYISVTQPVDIDDIESKANSAIQAADLGSAAYLDAGSSAGNVPVLDGGGKLSSGVLPAIALTNVSLVASQAAQLALTAQEGDVAVRSDESKTYIHNGGSAGDMTDWTEMQSPTGGVSSVFGRSGVVTAQTGDYTAAQVTNAFDKTADTLDDITAGSTNVHFTSTMSSKLSGIEALADVTDATNVAASGAIMDGDFSVNGLMKRTAAGTYGTATAGTDYYAPSGTDVAIADGGTGASTAAAAFSNLKQAATTTSTGVVEKSTSAENITGSAADKFPDVTGVKEMIDTFGTTTDSTPGRFSKLSQASFYSVFDPATSSYPHAICKSPNSGKYIILGYHTASPYIRAVEVDPATGKTTNLSVSSGTVTNDSSAYWTAAYISGTGAIYLYIRNSTNNTILPITLSGSSLTIGTAINPTSYITTGSTGSGSTVMIGDGSTYLYFLVTYTGELIRLDPSGPTWNQSLTDSSNAQTSQYTPTKTLWGYSDGNVYRFSNGPSVALGERYNIAGNSWSSITMPSGIYSTSQNYVTMSIDESDQSQIFMTMYKYGLGMNIYELNGDTLAWQDYGSCESKTTTNTGYVNYGEYVGNTCPMSISSEVAFVNLRTSSYYGVYADAGRGFFGNAVSGLPSAGKITGVNAVQFGTYGADLNYVDRISLFVSLDGASKVNVMDGVYKLQIPATLQGMDLAWTTSIGVFSYVPIEPSFYTYWKDNT